MATKIMLNHCQMLLVGGLEHFKSVHLLGISSSQLSYMFQRGGSTTRSVSHGTVHVERPDFGA